MNLRLGILGGGPLCALLVLLTASSFAAQPQLTCPGNGTCSFPQPDQWPTTSIAWSLNPDTSKNNIANGLNFRAVLTSSFATWSGAPNVAVQITQGADCTTCSESNNPLNLNFICFACSDTQDFTKDSETLGVTITTTQSAPGTFAQITNAFILFNPADCFTDVNGGSCPNGATGFNQIPLQVVATHEIGHFLGLDHSAVVRAVMFVSASDITTLSYDDVAGISFLYPKATLDVPTTTLSGTVRLNASGVYGAHVFADSSTTAQPFSAFGSVRKTPIGTYTIPGGTYTIRGLPADTYVVTAEPVDLPVQDSDLGLHDAYGQAVQTNFTTRWH
ncbi:MAG TPA: matrixin family metalloprotease [Terriglobales bacterium]|nr:matrixin family metalloprotease [Terriglobales bacterium]